MVMSKKPGGFKVPLKSVEEIRDRADIIRLLLCDLGRVSRLRDLNVRDLLERVLPTYFSLDLFVTEDDDSSDLAPGVPAGVSGGVLFVRDSVYQGMLSWSPRHIFTLFHELGHVSLEHTLVLGRAKLDSHGWMEDSEWQANCFAAEILMPLDVIRVLSLDEPWKLVDRFGVSEAAAIVRLEKLRKRHEI